MSNINDNNLFTLGLDISATKELMIQQLKQIAQELSNSQVMKITCTINKSETQREISQQLNNLIQNSSSRKTGNIKITADTRNALTSIKDVNKSLLSTTKTAKSFGEVVKSSFNFSVYLTILYDTYYTSMRTYDGHMYLQELPSKYCMIDATSYLGYLFSFDFGSAKITKLVSSAF